MLPAPCDAAHGLVSALALHAFAVGGVASVWGASLGSRVMAIGADAFGTGAHLSATAQRMGRWGKSLVAGLVLCISVKWVRSAGVNHSLTPRRLLVMCVDRQMSEPGAAFENVSPESLVALRRENDREGSVLFFKDDQDTEVLGPGAIDV